eukprot:m.68767 g.68767  ORF g.68767 m.68767 type:complete len:499 (-) comp12790_c0_seq1:79-1575(-)
MSRVALSSPSRIALAAAAAGLSVWMVILYFRKRARALNVPRASPWIPLLGNALAYAKNPPKFLAETAHKLGPVFELDLAGLVTVAVCSPELARQVEFASESVMSSRAPLEVFGFLEGLGTFSTHSGALTHKYVVKNFLYPLLDQQSELVDREAFQATCEEISDRPNIPTALDLFPTIRRIVIRATLRLFVSPLFMNEYPSFIEEYMTFQDQLEESIGLSVSLPRWIAKPMFLLPVQRRREQLEARVADALTRLHPAGAGVWLQHFPTAPFDEACTCQECKSYLERTPESAESATRPTTAGLAQMIVGLLSAAHKNAAIATAQTLSFLLGNAELREKVTRALAVGDQAPLNRCIEETLRLCAHSIGAMRQVMPVAGVDLLLPGARVAHLPQGTFVAISHSTPHQDPSLFPEPLLFNPDRLLPGDAAFPSSALMTLTTFSGGVHRCPGERLARAIMAAMCRVLLTKYTFELAAPLPPLDFSRATLAQRAGPVLVKVGPRG